MRPRIGVRANADQHRRANADQHRRSVAVRAQSANRIGHRPASPWPVRSRWNENRMVDPTRASGVFKAMVAMFASGNPSDAAAVVAEDYLDHQGLGTGPIRGIDGFALVVRTNYAAYKHLEISIEDLFGVDDRAVARIRWRGQRPDGEALTAKRSTSSELPRAGRSSTGAHVPELTDRHRGRPGERCHPVERSVASDRDPTVDRVDREWLPRAAVADRSCSGTLVT